MAAHFIHADTAGPGSMAGVASDKEVMWSHDNLISSKHKQNTFFWSFSSLCRLDQVTSSLVKPLFVCRERKKKEKNFIYDEPTKLVFPPVHRVEPGRFH